MPVDPVRRARSISSVEQAAALYAEWAPTYDADVFGELGFTGSARIAELLVSVLPDPTVPVIDLGCGTGAVGRRLAQLGVTTVDGVDLSPEMLAVAASSGAYRHLTVADLHAMEDQPDTYAASVSAGTFTTGHVGPEVVPRLLDLLRPEGVVAWVIATAVWPRVRARPRQEATRPAAPVRRSNSPRRTTRGGDVRRPHDRGQRPALAVSRCRPSPIRL